eukprot:jgi/Botrbrau1/4763/Bobra.0137s0035.1
MQPVGYHHGYTHSANAATSLQPSTHVKHYPPKLHLEHNSGRMKKRKSKFSLGFRFDGCKTPAVHCTSTSVST